MKTTEQLATCPEDVESIRKNQKLIEERGANTILFGDGKCESKYRILNDADQVLAYVYADSGSDAIATFNRETNNLINCRAQLLGYLCG